MTVRHDTPPASVPEAQAPVMSAGPAAQVPVVSDVAGVGSGSGRVPPPVDLRLLGIDFGGTKMAVAVADGGGRLLARHRMPTRADLGAQQALDRALDMAGTLAARAGGRLHAAGIASPGVSHEAGIDLAPNVPGWERLRLADTVRKRLGVRLVRVANDLNAAALAELRLGALRGADPGLVVGLGTGVAAAVTINGAVVTGHTGAAGEIGYAVATGRWPTLEGGFSGRALDLLADELGIGGGAAGLCAAAGSPGPARDALLPRVDELARHLATCCLLLDPRRVVLVGGVARDPLVRRLLRDRLATILPRQPEIVLSGFPDDAALLGAIRMAREAVGDGHPPAPRAR